MAIFDAPTTPRTKADGTRICGMADALELVGDRWSLLIIRELEFGTHRFNDIQRLTGAPREALAARLKKLEHVGVLRRAAYQDRPTRFEYHLTEEGHELRATLAALRSWGERFASSADH